MKLEEEKKKRTQTYHVSGLSTKNCKKNLNYGLGLLIEHGSEIRPTNWTKLLLSSSRSSSS